MRRTTMTPSRKPSRAIEFLVRLAPPDVLKQAHDLAQEMARDDYVRDYLARRAFLVVGAGLAALGVATYLIGGVLPFVLPSVLAIAPWSKLIVLALVAALWIGVVVILMMPLLRWLLRRAQRRWETQETGDTRGPG